MAMTKKLGTALKTGVTPIPDAVGGIAQTGNVRAGGELKTYYDEDGTPVSVYIFDDHTEYSWTALLEADAPDMGLGDAITVDSATCYITQYDVQEQNDDVKRVNITCRTTDLSAPAAGGGAAGGGN